MAEPPGKESAAETLQVILRALERYPAPLPIPVDSPASASRHRFAYVPSLEASLAIYAKCLQTHPLEKETAHEAFAAVAPRVLERCKALAKSQSRPGARKERLALLGDLSILAAVFVRAPGEPSSGPYAAVDGMIQKLLVLQV